MAMAGSRGSRGEQRSAGTMHGTQMASAHPRTDSRDATMSGQPPFLIPSRLLLVGYGYGTQHGPFLAQSEYSYTWTRLMSSAVRFPGPTGTTAPTRIQTELPSIPDQPPSSRLMHPAPDDMGLVTSPLTWTCSPRCTLLVLHCMSTRTVYRTL